MFIAVNKGPALAVVDALAASTPVPFPWDPLGKGIRLLHGSPFGIGVTGGSR